MLQLIMAKLNLRLWNEKLPKTKFSLTSHANTQSEYLNYTINSEIFFHDGHAKKLYKFLLNLIYLNILIFDMMNDRDIKKIENGHEYALEKKKYPKRIFQFSRNYQFCPL